MFFPLIRGVVSSREDWLWRLAILLVLGMLAGSALSASGIVWKSFPMLAVGRLLIGTSCESFYVAGGVDVMPFLHVTLCPCGNALLMLLQCLAFLLLCCHTHVPLCTCCDHAGDALMTSWFQDGQLGLAFGTAFATGELGMLGASGCLSSAMLRCTGLIVCCVF